MAMISILLRNKPQIKKMEVFAMSKSKKKFRLEDGTEVIGEVNVYKAYESKRNRERYLKRKQHQFVAFSLDEDWVQDISSDDDTAEVVENQLEVTKLRQAIRKLTVREQGIIIDYFFNDFSLRSLSKKYGASHTKINSEMKNALAKLREYITHN